MAETTPPPAPLATNLLQELPEQSSDGAPPIEETEARLDRISALVTRGGYAEAARMSETLLREGIRDVRLAGPYLLGVFLEQGLVAMPIIFSSVGKLLTTHWDAFGPPDKKTVHAQSGLRWLLKAINKHFEHHAWAKDDTWRRWSEPSNRQPIQEALEHSDELLETLESVLPGSGCDGPFRQLTTSLSNHLSVLPSAPPPRVEEPKAEAEHPDAADGENVPEMKEPPTPRAPGPAAPAPQATGPALAISPALALLMRKLEAFDALLERKDLARASVVAADVLHTIDHFDPRIYLPSLFSRFFGGLSTHADSVERLLQSTDSLAFRALEQLYRVDLNAFLAQDTGTLEE
jgi:hypothetical protein